MGDGNTEKLGIFGSWIKSVEVSEKPLDEAYQP
jgi:hypothetical protein